MPELPHLERMSILIEKDKETPEYVDYFFIADVREPDPRPDPRPRRNPRWMCTGQRRGLFRIHKAEQHAELLFPMDLDEGQVRFYATTSKILRDVRNTGSYPDFAHFASG